MTRKITHHIGFAAALVAAFLVHLLVIGAPILLLGRNQSAASDPRLIAMMFIVGLWFLGESLAGPARFGTSSKGAGPAWLTFAIGISLLATLWISSIERVLTSDAPMDATAVLAALLMLVGATLRCGAIRTLGPYFQDDVVMMPTQALVTSGLYGVLRHPAEAGTVCLGLGSALLASSIFGALALAVLAALVIFRTRLEDRMLLQHDPITFTEYARRVPALFPRLLPRQSEPDSMVRVARPMRLASLDRSAR